ncbi:hypothetical protein [Mesorhizobium sp.]|uniref:hypothetical protein n=1 Tax=Mesorhizobium sp. TaxID=1871066 RepID=UPI000FE5F777|nr:hypothetical protein [Mesorhizobium sp.]RWA73652.1 MAG: hypothetical protein EOQ29_04585 [Mesorhizobium sp.]
MLRGLGKVFAIVMLAVSGAMIQCNALAARGEITCGAAVLNYDGKLIVTKISEGQGDHCRMTADLPPNLGPASPTSQAVGTIQKAFLETDAAKQAAMIESAFVPLFSDAMTQLATPEYAEVGGRLLAEQLPLASSLFSNCSLTALSKGESADKFGDNGTLSCRVLKGEKDVLAITVAYGDVAAEVRFYLA